MDITISSKFDELLARHFSERLQAVKEVEVADRAYVLSELLGKEALALQQIIDNYEEITDEVIDRLVTAIASRIPNSNDPISNAFYNVKKGEA